MYRFPAEFPVMGFSDRHTLSIIFIACYHKETEG